MTNISEVEVENPNLVLWRRVFNEVREKRPEIPTPEQLKMIFEGCDGNGQEPQVLGIFQTPEKKFVAITFHYDGSWDDHGIMEIEIRDQFDDLILGNLLSPDQRAEVKAGR